MNYKTFNNLVTRLLEIKRDVDNLNKALKVFEPDFNYLCFGKYETLVVDAIKSDDDVNDWVGYFLWEMNGKFSKKQLGTNNGKKTYIKNMKDLYNIIYDKSI